MIDMKISVITVAFNAEKTIGDTIHSVAAQAWDEVEHIVIDGASTDGTLGVILNNEDKITKWISEADHGLYDAMNKGIDLATGDVIGFLNADDIYANDNVLTRVGSVLRGGIDGCYADVDFVRNDLRTVVRRYRSDRFHIGRLAYGWMPAHPSLFLRRELFERYGAFKLDYRIAADYELVVRFFYRFKIKAVYVPEVWVKMRLGGVSNRNLMSNYILSREIVRACRENGIQTNMFRVLLKYPLKMMEYVRRH
jgi:glycosyltransferase involved in cell wall biosynthesis